MGSLGGLVYAFGGAKEEFEVPLSLEDGNGSGYATSGSGSGPATQLQVQQPSDHRVCVLCLEESAVMATIPCGHRAYCSACAPNAQASIRTCPVCRQTLRNLLRVY